MALISKPFQIGKLTGTVYIFEKEGDTLEAHTHTELDNHISIVPFGEIEAFGRLELEGLLLGPDANGTIYDWAPHLPHGFRARCHSVMIQIQK